MKVFETTMRKNPSRQDYSIGIRKSEDVDESKFKDNRCDVIVCYQDEFQELNRYIQKLENEIEDKNKSIKNLENQLTNVDETHSKKINELSNEYYAKLGELKDRVSKKDSELKQMQLKYEGEISALNEDHLKKVNDLEKTYADEVLNLNKEISNLKQSHQADQFENVSAISTKKQNEIDNLKNELSAKNDELNQIELKLNDEITELKVNHEKEINALQKNHSNEVLKLNNEISILKQSNQKENYENKSSIIADKQKIIDDLKDEISEIKIHHKDEIADLKLKHNGTLIRLRTEDHNDILENNKKLGRIREDLKDLGFFEKHSNKYGLLLDEFDKNLNEFEKTAKNKLLNVDESFAELPINEVNEDSERND